MLDETCRYNKMLKIKTVVLVVKNTYIYYYQKQLCSFKFCKGNFLLYLLQKENSLFPDCAYNLLVMKTRH